MAGRQHPKPNNCQMAGERKINVERSQELNSYFKAVEGFLYGHFYWSISACLSKRNCPFLTPNAWGPEAWVHSVSHLLRPGRPPPARAGFQLLPRDLCRSLRPAGTLSETLAIPPAGAQSRPPIHLGVQGYASQAHRVFFGDICLFPWPITLYPSTTLWGWHVFWFFLDWKSEINDLFSLYSSIWEMGLLFTPTSLFIYDYTCIYFYMFYKDHVLQILCIWGSLSSMRAEILPWWIQSSQFRFFRHWT